LSKNVTRRFVAADSTVDAAMWRRTASPANPTVMPIFATPRSSSSSRVRSITLHRPTVVRQFDSSASPPMLTPLPAARINARDTMLRDGAYLPACPPSRITRRVPARRGTLRQPFALSDCPVTAANA
jgi:hypothetical protein